jgi:transposase-like protein
VGMLAKIRRMHLREHRSIREIARKTGLARNTVREWLRHSNSGRLPRPLAPLMPSSTYSRTNTWPQRFAHALSSASWLAVVCSVVLTRAWIAARL